MTQGIMGAAFPTLKIAQQASIPVVDTVARYSDKADGISSVLEASKALNGGSTTIGRPLYSGMSPKR